MTALVLSLLGLAVGPLAAIVVRRHPGPLHTIDGLTLIAVVGLVLLQILPEAFAVAGFPVLLTALAGFVLPQLAESALHIRHGRVHRLLVFVAMVGLVLHTALDGAALAQAAGVHADATEDHAIVGHVHGGLESGAMVSLAIVLHQVPVGLLVWILLRARLGVVQSAFALFALGLAMVVGFVGWYEIAEMAEGPLAAHLMALVGGGLLHVLLEHGEIGHEHEHADAVPVTNDAHDQPCQGHGHGPDASRGRGMVYANAADRKSAPRWAGAGALLGIGIVLFMAGLPALGGHSDTFASRFAVLFVASAQALLIGFLGAGLVHAFLPQGSMRWLAGGGPFLSALKGVMLGLPLPVCSCGVVPLYRTLVRRGAPPAAAIAFLIATPELGVDSFVYSMGLLGTGLTIVRVGFAFAIAMVAGLVVARFIAGPEAAVPVQDETAAAQGGALFARRPGSRLALALREGLGATVDNVAPWLLVGLAAAALLEPVIETSFLTRLPLGLDVLVLALIGLPSYVCASAATPLAAVFIAGGVSPGAAFAFLITGPATNVTTFGVLAALHGRRVAIVFGATVFLTTVALGMLMNVVMPAGLVMSMPALHEHGTSAVDIGAAIALLVVLGASLLRVGPRGWIAEIRGTRVMDEPARVPVASTHEHADGTCCGEGEAIEKPALRGLPMAREAKHDAGCETGCCE